MYRRDVRFEIKVTWGNFERIYLESNPILFVRITFVRFLLRFLFLLIISISIQQNLFIFLSNKFQKVSPTIVKK